jgi:Raf kinase inhibitor-like YbhB/YbcL family protein
LDVLNLLNLSNVPTKVGASAVALAVALSAAGAARLHAQAAPAKLTVTSTAFKDGETLPKDYTQDGKNVSPPLAWSGAPASTRQVAVVLHDPDAPMAGGFTHWVLYKVPGTATGLPEGVPLGATVSVTGATGAIQGLSGFNAFQRPGSAPLEPGYRGPAPPPGNPHHYHFMVYALDSALDLQPGLDRNALLKAMEGHIVGQGEIVGLYQRQRPQ